MFGRNPNMEVLRRSMDTVAGSARRFLLCEGVAQGTVQNTPFAHLC